ncbi:MAG: GntP family permease [Flavobacteriaceae bacterium]|nr:GntP family permease [Flavobacteriaceae bacterium]
MQTLLILFATLFLIVFATIKYKVHPVFSLIIASIIVGFLFGFDTELIIKLITEGFGKTLSSIGLIIAFGTTIGIFLEKNGGTKLIAEKILNKVSSKRSPLAMNIIGFIISIPVFCDSGFVILSSLNKALTKKTGIPLAVFAVALSTGLYAAHVFVPPTPGPLAAAAVIEADLGLVMLLGLAVAIPVSFTGYLWASYIGKKVIVDQILESKNVDKQVGEIEESTSSTSFLLVILPLLFPIILIALKSIAEYPTKPLGEGWLFNILVFIGQPIIALLLGVFLVFISSAKVKIATKNEWVITSLKESGSIILVTGAGGAFGNVLRASDLAKIVEPDNSFVISGLLIAFILAALLKTAQGSSTVAIITTAAIISPLLGSFGLETELEKALAVLAVGAGAMTVSHINDSYFWVVSQFSNLNVKSALKSHTVATFFQGIVGISILLSIQFFFT